MTSFLRALGVLFNLALLVLLIGVGALGYAWWRYGQNLPDVAQLATYEPPTVTRVHAGDGRLLAEFAKERRVWVPIRSIPTRMQQAFVAAEDQNFWNHHGIDPQGVASAVIDNLRRVANDERPRGASTITQQVAKNFLLTNEMSIDRKIKEAILSIRMERVLSKERILELYLNEIFLGYRAYGVAAAALNYFDKSLDELSLGEIAFIAGLPKAPSRYDPARNTEVARDRRDYVIGRMLADGYISPAEAEAAKAEPFVLRARGGRADEASADFFLEEVRRRLVAQLGEAGFYEGGLSVRTTVQPRIQRIADMALRRGLSSYDRRTGWRGPITSLPDITAGHPWQEALDAVDPGVALLDWKKVVVLAAGAKTAEIGFADGKTGTLNVEDLNWARTADSSGKLGPAPKRADQVLKAGDVVLVEDIAENDKPSRWALRQRPAVEGSVVVLDPNTGRVLAITGGFDFRQSTFNRATQAWRQPGSSFKPFVYLAALENGYTPASIVLDAPIVVDQGPGLPKWKPENYSQRFYGPSTLRLGLEKSRNLMTVRLAQAIGMEKVIDVAQRFGIDRGLQHFLAGSLGSNEVTLLGLTSAYAELANGGKKLAPILIERIQDRYGATLMRRDDRPCDGCAVESYAGGFPPVIPDTRPAVTDPRYAYQMTNMLAGVVERGTAASAAKLGRPLAGKTGTSNDAKDAWFIGFSPDLVTGVFIGYDQPRSMGDTETGASLALPIWTEIMGRVLADTPPTPFRVPPGVELVRIDAQTGALPGADTAQVILEAFLPGTAPTSEEATDQVVGGGETAFYDPAAPRTAAPREPTPPPVTSDGLY
ncbi:MAG TPA: penicillin-binding protein 1A [Geminicoccus sp.]|uniref:penicillin-binding protein 1A n=1 Tax=Geminicoccus sp. TaxID=2024832 RepID=UPI002E377154|nr:penicillin-binding protein 1A [Geminicoccus sp.]HEX2525868.1 penicillin-binding protein 1A [Geminicoccus sp.]